MGLDIYAGTLTRYYTHNWKTAVQQWAEENGYGFQVVRPTGEVHEEESVSPAEVQRQVENWRDQILAVLLSGPGQEFDKPWVENNEKPYYTDKPDWDAFGALLLVAACHVYGEPVPETVEKGWDFMEHPSVKRVSKDGREFWRSLFRGTECWLPLSDCYLFRSPLPTGDKKMMSTIGSLRRELEQLNDMAWQAGEETILSWSRTEGYPADGKLGPSGALTMGETHLSYDTESLAKFAFSIFWQAVNFAEENQVPVLLDY